MSNQNQQKSLSWKKISLLVISIILIVLGNAIATGLISFLYISNIINAGLFVGLIKNAFAFSWLIRGIGIFLLCFVGYTTHFKVNYSLLRRQFMKTPLLIAIIVSLLCFATIAEAPIVSAEKMNTMAQGWKICSSFGIYDWWIGQLSDNTYFAMRGSDGNVMTFVEPWQNPAPWAAYASNLANLETQVLATITSGTVYCKDVLFDYTLTIPANVRVIEDVNGLQRQFVSASDSEGSPFIISIDTVNPTYYLAQDRAGRIINSYSSTNATYVIQQCDVVNASIKVGKGTFTIAAPSELIGISIANAAEFCGSGVGGTLFDVSTGYSAYGSGITITSPNCYVHDFTVNSSGVHTDPPVENNGALICLSLGAADLVVERVKCTNGKYYGIGTLTDCPRLMLRDCETAFNGDDGTALGGPVHDVTVDNLYSHDNDGVGPANNAALEIEDGAYNINVVNCDLRQGSSGDHSINIHTHLDYDKNYYVNVANNRISGQAVIQGLGVVTSTSMNINFHDNIIQNGDLYIYQVNNTHITNNIINATIAVNAVHIIIDLASGKGVSDNLVFSGNTFIGLNGIEIDDNDAFTGKVYVTNDNDFTQCVGLPINYTHRTVGTQMVAYERPTYSYQSFILNNGWDDDHTPTGSASQKAMSTNVYTGTGTNAVGKYFCATHGLMQNPRNYVNWSKTFLSVSFSVARSGDDAQVLAYIQLKENYATGVLGEKGIGIDFANFTVSAESYGSARGTAAVGTIDENTMWAFKLTIEGGVTYVWLNKDITTNYYSLIASFSGANVPTTAGAAAGYFVISIQNGAAGGTSCYLYVSNILIEQSW